jgi:hypothetical protein
MGALSGPGLIFYGFSVTFMAIDWVLSINPHWFSTMFGLLFIAGQGLSGDGVPDHRDGDALQRRRCRKCSRRAICTTWAS